MAMNLALVIWAMAAAGAERVLVQLANDWSERGNAVTIITFDKTGESFYRLDGRVRVQPLSAARNSKNFAEAASRNLRAIWMLRSALRACRPDVVISFIDRTNVSTILATRGLGFPVIVSERTDRRAEVLVGYGKRCACLRIRTRL